MSKRIYKKFLLLPKRKFTRSLFDVQIVDLKSTEFGVDVFIKAFRNGDQIGFGRDGTIDVERFRIHNPPSLVPDDSGAVLRSSPGDPDLGLEPYSQRFREDPHEAILQVVEHALTVMKNVHGSSKIKRGKIGNTTSIFYPDPGPPVTAVDGSIFGGDTTNWETSRDAVNGALIDSTSTLFNVQTAQTGSGKYNLRRGFFLFDTSSLGTDTIDSATLSLWGIATQGDYDNDGDDFICIIPTDPASDDELVLADFSAVIFTEVHDSGDRIDIGSISNGAYNSWPLNSFGLSKIDPDGVSKFGALEGHDLLDIPYAGAQNSSGNWEQFSAAGETGTTQDEKLVVEHTSTVSYKISGEVTLNGEAVEGATVRIIDQDTGDTLTATTTDSEGAYSFSDLDSESLYHLCVEYEDESQKYYAFSYWDIEPYEVVE